MSLRFSFDKCVGYQQETDDGLGYYKTGEKDAEGGDLYELAVVSNALVWHALNTGIGTITEKNASEVFARVAFVESLYGPSCVLPNEDGELEPTPITFEVVHRHIGMTTNVSYKEETRSSFLKRHAAARLDEEKRSYERALAEHVEHDGWQKGCQFCERQEKLAVALIES